MAISGIGSQQARHTGFFATVVDKARQAKDMAGRVAYAVAMPVYLGTACAVMGAGVIGSVAIVGGPLTALAGAISGGLVGAQIGVGLGAKLGAAALFSGSDERRVVSESEPRSD